MVVVSIHRVVGVDQGDIQLLCDAAGQEKVLNSHWEWITSGRQSISSRTQRPAMAVRRRRRDRSSGVYGADGGDASRDQEWSDWDSVRIRTSWPRRSNSRCRFFTEVTTPFTAGVYQSVVIRIFITGSLLSSCSPIRRSPAERFNFRNIFSVPV